MAGKVFFSVSMSLDGYVAPEGRMGEDRWTAQWVELQQWLLGQRFDEELSYEHAHAVCAAAAATGTTVTLDMEDHETTDETLDTLARLRADFPGTGAVLQAYLHRTPADLEELLPLEPNLRLVKGAYLEPPSVALPRKADVDAAYARLLERMLAGTGHTAVATHDESLIEHAIRFAAEHDVPRERFELQLLYGVRPQLQLDLVRRGSGLLRGDDDPRVSIEPRAADDRADRHARACGGFGPALQPPREAPIVVGAIDRDARG